MQNICEIGGQSMKSEKFCKTIKKLCCVICSVLMMTGLYSSNVIANSSGTDGEQPVVFTEEEKEYIKNHGEIKVALIANRAPFSYVNSDGQADGITVDIMKLIAQESGLTFSYSSMGAGERVVDYMADNPDAIAAGIMTDNPQFSTDDYLVSDVFYRDDVSLVCKSGFKYDLDASDNTYILAIPKSYAALEVYIKERYPQFEIVEATDTTSCIKMVLNGKADFMAQNVKVITPILQNPHYEGLTILPTFFMDENMGIVCANTEDNEMLISILNKCIASISDKELSQFTIYQTVANGYRLSVGDMVYKFRYPLTVVILLLCILFAFMIVWQITRRRNFVKLEEKNKQLGEAVAQADSANQAKTQFLARMSHEIRTPMNAIVGLTAITRYHKNEPEKVEEYIEKIDTSSKILLNIINDVLDMSAIESDKIKIAHEAFDIRSILTVISTMYYSQCKQKGIRFEMNTAEIADENLLGDGMRVNQILLNLISNAFKFTKEGGRITITAQEISAKEGKAYLNFTVEDTGEGMTKEMQERLFKPFEQETATTAQKHGGSGLGLSIAKNLVEMMSGTISFTSEKGVGTTFKVSIPFDIDEQAIAVGAEKYKTIRALIVDDDKDTREYTSIILNRLGVPYAVAVNGRDAIEKLQHAKEMGSEFDICFIDWKMPDMSGGAVTRQIRQLYEKDTLIIIVSAYDTMEIQEDAVLDGADLFIKKPLFQSTVFNLLVQLSGGKYVNRIGAEKNYDFEGRTILLAEDIEFNGEIAIELLNIVNMKVDWAKNGKIAVEKFEAAAPGTYTAILMDVQMPEMNGYEATKAIRDSSHPEAKTIPIYAMTANAFIEDVSASLNAGMNGHISKPIDTEILYETLNNIVCQEKGKK